MKFETPVVEVKKFDVTDIITTSGETEEIPAFMGSRCTSH